MNSKTLIKLAGALVVLGGIALFMNREPGEESGHSSGLHVGDKILEDLDVNAVATIRVSSQDKNSTVTRKNDKWVVDSLYDYEADFDKIVDNLTEWSELKAADLPRGGDDAEYGLDTNATVVSLLDASGRELAALKLGENRESKSGGQFGGGMPDGRFMRIGDGPVLLVSENMMSLPTASEDWIKKDFLSVNASDITEISLTVSNQTTTINSADTANYQVTGLSTNEEANTANCGRAHRAIQSLRFESIADPALDNAGLGFDQPVIYTAKTKDGLSYSLKVGKEVKDGSRYARLTTRFAAPPAPTLGEAEKAVPPDAPKPEGEAAPEDAPEDAPATPEKTREEKVADKLQALVAAHAKTVADTQKKVDDLAPLAKWVYVLDDLDVEPMVFARKDLVRAKEKADDNTEPADGTPPPGIGLPPGISLPPGLTPPTGTGLPPRPAPTGEKPKTVVTTPPIRVPALPKAEPLKDTDGLIEKAGDALKDANEKKVPGIGELIETPKLNLKPNDAGLPKPGATKATEVAPAPEAPQGPKDADDAAKAKDAVKPAKPE
jgi:hypothetical protein